MQFLITLVGVVVFILILGIIIAVHEGGHFLFARRAGILAREFAFGMGPILWKKKKGETLYSIRAFPIGGFCAIAGEELEDDPFRDKPRVKLDVRDGVIYNFYLNVQDENINYLVYDIMEYDLYDEANTGNLYMEVIQDGSRYHFKVDPQAVVHMEKVEYQIAPYNRTLGSKSKRARAMVMFGGPLMNFLLGIVAFFLAALFSGFPVYESNKISGMDPEAPTVAYMAGLRNDDRILNLKTKDGVLDAKIESWNDVSSFMAKYTEKGNASKIIVTYERNGAINELEVLPSIMLNNLAIETQVFYVNGAPYGLKVLNYIEAKDELIDNSALANYFGENKELIITKFIYENNTIDAYNVAAVYNLMDSYVGDKEITIKFASNGVLGEAKVTPYSKKIMDYQYKTNGVPLYKVQMGISPEYRFNFLKSVKYGFTETLTASTAVLSTLKMLFNKTVSIKSLSSFVGIGAMTVKFVQQGLVPLLNWLGLLSVNIGLMNLLPIPALDGGRLLFVGYEAVTGKKPNPKVETVLISITMLLLFGLMIYVTINDIIRQF